MVAQIRDDDELVAPNSGDRVLAAEAARQQTRNLGENGVAHRVPEGVVDVLEADEVQVQHSRARVPGPAFQLLEHGAPVGQAGQGIGACRLPQTGLPDAVGGEVGH